jgi:hypothetical protein
VHEPRIASLPEHGLVQPRGRTDVIYRPNPRFRGEDSFALVVRGRLAAAGDPSLVHIHVVVR